MWLCHGDWPGLHNTHKPTTWGFTTPTAWGFAVRNNLGFAVRTDLGFAPEVSPWGPSQQHSQHNHRSFATTTTCLGFHSNTTHPQIHNPQIQTNPPPQTDPSQPPPPPVLGFIAAQHTHKSTTHESKPIHHPKPILRLHWSIKLHGQAWELNPQNPISKHSIGLESLSKINKKESAGGERSKRGRMWIGKERERREWEEWK